ncbi:unnamed protein product [Brachionus calyciflorus]|uniref:Prohormone-4 n=1 Tax=Brachionus calyciflorus TaxID=104777 RepID=A0A813YV02_9BILA|nr:unnamed protein product [Brachionus calyciflorus]
MKLVSIIICLILTTLIDAKLTFPMVYRWSKRTKNTEGCIDPTEPFQCPGSNICISLQFICDGHPGDCPNDFDEDQGLCVAARRPPKDTIRRLLSAQYSNFGSKFIEYLFGSKALKLFSGLRPMEAIDIITISLSVSPSIDEFARVMEMTKIEKNRLANVLESLHTGQVSELPAYIVNSASEGLGTLTDQLIKTNFLKPEEK